MKRFFFLAVAATAMLAACNKTEIVPTGDPQEISFVAVNKVATKTPVSGVDFLDSDKMQVAAYIVAGSEEAGDFFGKTLFEKSGSFWKGNPARYWPLSSSVINFLAITDNGGNVSDKTNISFPSPFTKTATVQLSNNACLNQTDLMYAAGQGSHDQGGAYNDVDMVFKHALSWVNFKFSTPNTTGYQIVVNSVKLDGACYDGTLTLDNADYDQVTPAPTTAAVVPSWSPSDAVNNIFVPNADGSAKATALPLTSTPTLFGNGLLVVPGYATSFTINYTLIQEDGTDNTFNYKYNLPSGGSWKMAMKYFYNINITLSEIEVDPSVTRWDETNVPVEIK